MKATPNSHALSILLVGSLVGASTPAASVAPAGADVSQAADTHQTWEPERAAEPARRATARLERSMNRGGRSSWASSAGHSPAHAGQQAAMVAHKKAAALHVGSSFVGAAHNASPVVIGAADKRRLWGSGANRPALAARNTPARAVGMTSATAAHWFSGGVVPVPNGSLASLRAAAGNGAIGGPYAATGRGAVGGPAGNRAAPRAGIDGAALRRRF